MSARLGTSVFAHSSLRRRRRKCCVATRYLPYLTLRHTTELQLPLTPSQRLGDVAKHSSATWLSVQSRLAAGDALHRS